MWNFIKLIVVLAIMIAGVMLLRTKLAGATWKDAWNDNFGGLIHVGPAPKV